MIKRILTFFIIIFGTTNVNAQGLSNNWQIGYATTLSPPYDTHLRGTISFPSNTISAQGVLNRKMKFNATYASISDRNGNLQFVSNGIWIANTLGDTMQNGSGLNPGPIATQFYSTGMRMLNSNLILPYPGDSTKFILFHDVGNPNTGLLASELFYTIVDMKLDGGLGGVALKNQIVFQDTLMWAIAACKHSNGRDWWVVMVKDGSDKIFKVLVTPFGIGPVTWQTVGGTINYSGSLGQSSFSPDGKKFAYTSVHINTNPSNTYTTDTRLLDFDRCTGVFSNLRIYPLSNLYAGYGIAFSANSKFLYSCTVHSLFQINADSTSIVINTVATNDVFPSPFPATYTDLSYMYRAPDEKIYIMSGNSVLDLHYINYPDSAGLACDVHLHDFHLPCFIVRTTPNHPNYELGAETGTVCDTILSIRNSQFKNSNHELRINPNPAHDGFYINYDFNVTDNPLFELYDSFGKEILKQTLYGTMRSVYVHCETIPNGVYYYTVSNRNRITNRGKVAIAK